MTGSIFDLMKQRTVLLDGALGTELIKNGLSQGACPEVWNVERPEIVKAIHKSYYDAGSDAVVTNSFGGNKIKLAAQGLENRCYELNYAAASIVRDVKPRGTFVGGCLGPTGKFLKPQGEFAEEEFEDAFFEQAKGLSDGKVDFLMIETQYDLKEALCAVRGAKRATDLPIFVTMTFNRGPRGFFTMMGASVAQSFQALEAEGVSATGTNCTLNSEDMTVLVKIMRENTSLPLIAQANAGRPFLSILGEVSYSQDIEDYVRFVPQMIQNGANLIGGCCGTNPAYIKKMAALIKKA